MRYYSNTSRDMTLTVAVDATATSITVNDASGLPLQFPFNLAIDAGLSSVEIVEVTAAASNTLTVVRGRQDTSGKPHTVGAVVYHAWTALDGQEAQAHFAATQNVHGVGTTASVVGTNTTQTLINKTIDGSANTITNIPDSAIGSLSGSKITGVISTATIPGANVTNPLNNAVVAQPTIASPAIDVQGSATATTFASRITGREGQDVLRIKRNNSNTTGNLLNFVNESDVSVASVSRAGNFVTQSLNATGNVTATAAMSAGTTFTAGGNITTTGGGVIASDGTKHFTLGSRNVDEEGIRRFSTVAARTAALPTPTRGMVTWTDEKAQLEIYDNAAWRVAQGLGSLYATSSYSASLATGSTPNVTPWALSVPPSSSDFWTASGSSVTCLIPGGYFLTVNVFINSAAAGQVGGRVFVDFSSIGTVGPFNGWTRSGFGDGIIQWSGYVSLPANEQISLRVEAGNNNITFDRARMMAFRVN